MLLRNDQVNCKVLVEHKKLGRLNITVFHDGVYLITNPKDGKMVSRGRSGIMGRRLGSILTDKGFSSVIVPYHKSVNRYTFSGIHVYWEKQSGALTTDEDERYEP